MLQGADVLIFILMGSGIGLGLGPPNILVVGVTVGCREKTLVDRGGWFECWWTS